jgi:hypothetical protein
VRPERKRGVRPSGIGLATDEARAFKERPPEGGSGAPTKHLDFVLWWRFLSAPRGDYEPDSSTLLPPAFRADGVSAVRHPAGARAPGGPFRASRAPSLRCSRLGAARCSRMVPVAIRSLCPP